MMPPMKTPPPSAASDCHHGEAPVAKPMTAPQAETTRTTQNNQSVCQGTS